MANPSDTVIADALLSMPAVIAATSLSKASIYRLMRKGRFPQAKELVPGGRRVAWRRSEVMAWATDPLTWGHPVNF